MVAGIDSFRDKFRGFEDCYTVIPDDQYLYKRPGYTCE